MTPRSDLRRPAMLPGEIPGEGDTFAPVGNSGTPNTLRTIAEIKLGPTTWRVDSHCGVVKIHSSRDGCMVALNPVEARRAAGEIAQALTTAAWSVDRASRGGVR